MAVEVTTEHPESSPRQRSLMFAAAAFTMACTVAWVLVTTVFDLGEWARTAKMAGSCGFLATAFFAGAFGSRFGRIVFVGLVFSWFGDLFLSYSGMFLWGLISFLLGHVAYSAAFALHTRNARRSSLAMLVIVPMAVGVYAWLLPHLDDMRVPVLAYTAVISVMVVLAAGLTAGPGGWLAFVGAVAFWISDIFVARGAFVTSDIYNRVIGSPLYFGGQVLIAVSIAYVVSGASNSPQRHGEH
jgi:uncharacterized membrane protein YhhN